MDKLIVDLSHPIWLEKGGYGAQSAYASYDGSKCAVGKFNVACKHYDGPYDLIKKYLSPAQLTKIWEVNDGTKWLPDQNIWVQDGKPNHETAVRMMLEFLGANKNVEFAGTELRDVAVKMPWD